MFFLFYYIIGPNLVFTQGSPQLPTAPQIFEDEIFKIVEQMHRLPGVGGGTKIVVMKMNVMTKKWNPGLHQVQPVELHYIMLAKFDFPKK